MKSISTYGYLGHDSAVWFVRTLLRLNRGAIMTRPRDYFQIRKFITEWASELGFNYVMLLLYSDITDMCLTTGLIIIQEFTALLGPYPKWGNITEALAIVTDISTFLLHVESCMEFTLSPFSELYYQMKTSSKDIRLKFNTTDGGYFLSMPEWNKECEGCESMMDCDHGWKIEKVLDKYSALYLGESYTAAQGVN